MLKKLVSPSSSFLSAEFSSVSCPTCCITEFLLVARFTLMFSSASLAVTVIDECSLCAYHPDIFLCTEEGVNRS